MLDSRRAFAGMLAQLRMLGRSCAAAAVHAVEWRELVEQKAFYLQQAVGMLADHLPPPAQPDVWLAVDSRHLPMASQPQPYS